MEVEKELARYRVDRLNREREAVAQKRRDMALKYEPWGKPGGGAPPTDTNDYKRKNFLEYSSTEQQKGQGDDGFYDQFGRQGGGAPLKSDSGHLLTELRGDPIIRFQDNDKAKRVINDEVRYRLPEEQRAKYSNDLKQQMADQAMSKELARLTDIKQDQESLQHDPYGRPGAGAPNKTQSEGRTNSAKDGQQFYEPWGKGFNYPPENRPHAQPPGRRARMIDRDRGVLTQSAPGKGIHVGGTIELGTSQGAGAPLRTDSGHIKTRMAATLKKDNFGENIVARDPRNTSKDPFDPWGKAGAGAPLKDDKGRMVTTIYGKIHHESIPEVEKKKAANNHLFRDQQNYLIQEQKSNRDKWDFHSKQGAGEFAPLIQDGVVGKPRRNPDTGMLLNQHLPSSDVTRQQVGVVSLTTAESPRWHTELQREACERKQLQELEKLRDQRESRQHAQKFDNFWGKPGGGAPNIQGVRIGDINEHLYSPRQGYGGSDYSGSVAASPALFPQSRKAVPSHHLKSYDYENHSKERKRDYKLATPWATEA